MESLPKRQDEDILVVSEVDLDMETVVEVAGGLTVDGADGFSQLNDQSDPD